MTVRPLLHTLQQFKTRKRVLQKYLLSGRAAFRVYSSRAGSYERIQVPVHHNGHIDVDLYLPSRSRKAAPHEREVQPLDAIVRLPSLPSGLISDTQSRLLLHDNGPLYLAELSNSASVPVIQPHYRLGVDHLYPTPIHDIAVAYEGAVDWLRTNRKKTKSSETQTDPQEAREQLQVGVTGELVGGSLALALGLTECRITDAARVVAVNVNEPILDWVFEHDTFLKRDATLAQALGFDGVASGKERTNYEDEIDAFHLLRHRSFPGRHPFRYFDPFASPVHFLRSPSGRLPNFRPGEGPQDQNAFVHSFEDTDEDAPDADELEEEETARVVGAPELVASPQATSSRSEIESSTSTPPSSNDAAPKVRRPMAPNDPRRFKRPLRYPSADHAPAMILPRIQISTRPQSLLRPQAEDFIRLLRRGLLRGKGYKMSKGIEKLMMDESLLEAEEQKQAGHDLVDERLALIKRGMRQFKIHSESKTGYGDASRLATWFTGG